MLDFGTTFSGCSYVFANDNIDERLDIAEWPKRGGSIYPKISTASFYNTTGKKEVPLGFSLRAAQGGSLSTPS
ncbi:hypothetical protein PHYBLDRAFT_145262 [Phycomyces blakesleeanus NRRL 1555(-)]|uniref:Uncharacterized protein n=1 Tax=Phycomyces blakesleeanus (strain ATCC 8743b / DSM 1359 / FGSC 10004 / NBRC 33097 / NRRL 1555) TaxID=763407 RepID=A0A163DW62_PHYB8|nr:hypothetical protein PHYBLDRAFT_145262 [Phycomyces blakesleeanus NRRL 1555(-)]OAD73790.1 hypothetical protein PHYBLDRAFT_145262 [Phycomyces blakesleeanus NRRL 1555(-)]|eukprot:XP_018291830.1 hypothetical protein PHYBLDRAFT_145262 [Phycomyces blakesleeanus NRRL 1555(-)]